MGERERGQTYLADLLGSEALRELAEQREPAWLAARRPDPAVAERQREMVNQYAEQVRAQREWWRRQMRELRGHRADVVLQDDVVDWAPSDHGTGRALDTSDSPATRGRFASLMSIPPADALLPPELLPDRIRYAPAVEHDRHGRSVAQWAARQERDRGRRVPPVQQQRLVKFLDHWTRP